MSRVSIVVPVYNAEKYLNKCVESILQQTYGDFEIILVDDGSKDDSGSVCDVYEDKYERISAIHTENRGPAAARRTGVEAAQGEYIVFIDADDWIDRDMLSAMMLEIQTCCADIVCFMLKEVDEQGNILSIKHVETERLEMTTRLQMMRNLHGTRFIDSGPCAKIMARRLFENIDYCENVTIGEDYFMILQILEKASKVVFCKKPMYNRCMRTTSISRSGYSERHKQAFETYMDWRMYLLDRYPELETDIISYHLEYEMAVITAMCRNRKYDRAVIRKLAGDLRKNRNTIIRCNKTPLYMKVSAVMIAYCYPLFMIIFRMIHLLTGR